MFTHFTLKTVFPCFLTFLTPTCSVLLLELLLLCLSERWCHVSSNEFPVCSVSQNCSCVLSSASPTTSSAHRAACDVKERPCTIRLARKIPQNAPCSSLSPYLLHCQWSRASSSSRLVSRPVVLLPLALARVSLVVSNQPSRCSMEQT